MAGCHFREALTTQDDLAAGPELDALVATKVMGWQVRRFRGDDGIPGVRFYTPNAVCWGYELPKFSTDISAAWQIVEHFNKRGRDAFFELDYAPHVYGARFKDNVLFDWADTAPLAICRAALAAVSTS